MTVLIASLPIILVLGGLILSGADPLGLVALAEG